MKTLKEEILLVKMESVAVLLSDSRDPNMTIEEFRRPYLARIKALEKEEGEIAKRTELLLADGWTRMGDLFYKDDLVTNGEVITTHPLAIEAEVGE